MDEIEPENPLATRHRLVLSEFRQNKPIFETFEILCKKLGDGFMDYQEFEFWFQRFSSGNFDLDYDKSYTISNDFEEFSIWSWPGEVLVIMVNHQQRTTSNHRLTYTKITDDLYTVFDTKDCYEYVKMSDFREKAVEDIYSILESRLEKSSERLEEFTINGHHMETEFARKLIQKCRALKGKVGARKLQIPIGPFLPMLQYLQMLDVEIRKDQGVTVVTKEDFEMAVETMNLSDRCERANISFSKKMMMMDTEWTVIKKLMCQNLNLTFEHLDVDHIKNMLKIFLQPSRYLKEVRVSSNSIINKTEIVKFLLEIGAINRPQPSPWYQDFRYEVPNSKDNQYFYISVYGDQFIIKKYEKSRSNTAIDFPVKSMAKTMSETPSKMPENVLNNPIAHRSFILYEVLKKSPIFETFKKLCGKFEDSFMDYQEFEFWWMRFEQGKFDLDYDRSQDPKYRTFDDLPMNILEKIFDKVNVNMHFILRHVCRSFRALADKRRLDAGDTVKIKSTTGNVEFKFGCWWLRYKKISEDSFTVINGCGSNKTEKYGKSHLEHCRNPNSCYKYVQSGNYQDVAIDDIYSVLSHPDLTVNELEFDNFGVVEPGFAEKLHRKFGSLKQKIHVEEIDMPFGAFIPILHHVQPGILKNLILNPNYTTAEYSTKSLEEGMKMLNKMEQYQQAELIFSQEFMRNDSCLKIVENLEASKFVLHLQGLSTEQVMAVLKILLKSSKFIEKGMVVSYNNMDELKKKLCEFGAIDVSRNDPEEAFTVLQYQPPNSDIIHNVLFDEVDCVKIESESISSLVKMIDV